MFLPALHREYPAESLQTLTDFLTETFQDHSAREQRETRFSVATELQGYLHEDGLGETVTSVPPTVGTGQPIDDRIFHSSS
jgi:hypothetical protein